MISSTRTIWGNYCVFSLIETFKTSISRASSPLETIFWPVTLSEYFLKWTILKTFHSRKAVLQLQITQRKQFFDFSDQVSVAAE